MANARLNYHNFLTLWKTYRITLNRTTTSNKPLVYLLKPKSPV